MRFFLVAFISMTLISFQCCKSSKKTVEKPEPSQLNMLFYNVENLFDTLDHPDKFDEDFTPDGRLQWNTERYQKKLDNLSRVITQDYKVIPDIVGVCEVENKGVVEDLFRNAAFEGTTYKVVHRESPDGRGIDVALAYNPNKISFEEVAYVESKLPFGDRPNTRLAMYARGIAGSDTLHVIVNHWPSRHGGQQESEPNRLTVAYNVKQVLDSIYETNKDARIIMMGDFNDHPNNKSLMEIINARKDEAGDMINLMWEQHKMGNGSYNYRGDWGALDQFIVSPELVLSSSGYNVKNDEAKFVRFPWMMYTNKDGEAYPNRTYGGPNYYGGYSDHLPIYMVLDYSKP